MDEHDLTRLLREGEARPERPVDVDAIVAGVGARRRKRRNLSGLAAAVLLLVVAVAGVMIIGGGDEGAEVQVIDPPPTSTTSTTAPRSTYFSDLPGYIPPRDPHGVAIAHDEGLSLVSLDGSEFWAPDLTLGDPSTIDGLASKAFSRVPQAAASGIEWWSPHQGGHWPQSEIGAGLTYGGFVAGPSSFLIDHDGETPIEVGEVARWWLSSDMRVVTWTACEEGCPHRTYDSLTSEVGDASDSCWVAAAHLDQWTWICDDGARVVVDGHSYDVGSARGGQPARALAAWADGLVWLDYETCFDHEAVLLRNGAVQTVVGPDRFGAPSAVPLGWTPDGRVMVHLNSAACDAAAPDLGVHIVDPETHRRERIWSGSAMVGEVRAWFPVPPRPWLLPEGTIEVDLAALGERFVVWGDSGVGRLIDGIVEWWPTDGGVMRGFDDGSGGVVFQELGGHPAEGIGAVSGAIVWIADGAATPRVLVAEGEGDGAVLHRVVEIDGAQTVLYSRFVLRPDHEHHLDGIATLYAYDLATERQRSLGEVDWSSYEFLGNTAYGDPGLVVEICGMVCTWLVGPDLASARRISKPEFSAGFDLRGDLLAVVEHERPGTAAPDPALVLRAFGGEERVRLRLPYDPDGYHWPTVELSADGRSALVVFELSIVHEPRSCATVIVRELDTPNPTLQLVRSDLCLGFRAR